MIIREIIWREKNYIDEANGILNTLCQVQELIISISRKMNFSYLSVFGSIFRSRLSRLKPVPFSDINFYLKFIFF
jgi:hypothetical protein